MPETTQKPKEARVRRSTPKPKLRNPPIKRRETLPEPPPRIDSRP